MPFISSDAHNKFTAQCKDLVNASIENEQALLKAGHLKTELDELEELLQQYLHIIAQIPGITQRYNLLQRRIRVTARKLQFAKAIRKDSAEKASG